MKTVSSLINDVRKRLEKKGLTPEASESLLGLLSALMTTSTTDTSRDENLMMRLADAMADSSSLLILIQQQAAELDALKRITFNLTTSLDLQAVLNGVVEEAMRLVKDADDAHIFLYQDQKISFGASLQADGKKNEVYAEPRPEGLTYHVARTGEMLVIEDMREHPLYQTAPDTWSGSIIGIPLKIGGRVIGVMNLARTRTGEFTQPEIRLLALLADQAAIAIINARLHAAVSHQARSDVLTGLPNRRALDERLDDEIKRSARSGRVFCVIMMDLDGFKQVNDTYGHDVGDDVLRQIARSLQENLRTSDFLARYGGDELTLVLSETDLNQAEVVVEKINRNLDNLVLQLPEGKTTSLGISGGIAIYPKHAQNAPGLLRAADEALYHAKRSGGGSFQAAQDINA
ncbi:MAG: sensor domain-containing diguanylate cyclase [Chloroflexota bacterium]